MSGPINRIPKELLLCIGDHCDQTDLAAFIRVSKRYYWTFRNQLYRTDVQANSKRGLFEAILSGDIRMVFRFLNAGADSEPVSNPELNCTFFYRHGNRSALQQTVRSQRIDIVKMLLNCGVPVNIVGATNRHALFDAIEATSCKHLDQRMLRLLLDAGANINVGFGPDSTVVDAVISRSDFPQILDSEDIDSGRCQEDRHCSSPRAGLRLRRKSPHIQDSIEVQLASSTV